MPTSKVPVKLKLTCLNQISQALYLINLPNKLCLALSKYNHDDHIAFKLIIAQLAILDDITYQLININQSPKKLLVSNQCILISNEGDTFILKRIGKNSYRATAYNNIDEEIEVYEGDLKTLSKTLNLSTYALLLNSIKSSSRIDRTSIHDQTSYVLRHFTNHRNLTKKTIGISLLISLLSIATPIGFQTFTDKILPYSAHGSLMVVATLLLLGAMASSVFQCFRDYQESILFAKYQNGLGKEVFSRLLSMDIPFFDRQKIGDLTKLIDQIQEASNFLVRQLLSSAVSVISLLVVLPILFLYSPMLSTIVLGIGLLMATTVALSLKSLRSRVLQSYSYDASYQSTMIEMVKGMRTIKSLANESHFKHQINTRLETNLYGDFQIAKLSHVVRAIINFQSQLITIAIIFFGAQAVFANEMSIGQLIAFNMMAGNVVNPLLSLVMTASGWETFKLAKARLEELKPPAKNPLTLQGDNIDLNGDIEFQNVWFKYPTDEQGSEESEDTYVLKGINLTIQQNEIIGIVGGSGSGKSTLANLLLGFYKPTKGKIKINGYDIVLVPPEALRARISSVQQTNFLFNTSIAENIHLGRLNSSIEDIQVALEASGSTEFIDEMPQKFLSNLSEDGANLSGGQRQRLAIARALVRNSDVLLFDEATSALDNQTEEKVKETIYQACQNKTGIIIAHRLNTLSYCDRIVVMQHGNIEVVGTHDELILQKNSYKAMWDATLKRDAALDRLELKASTKNNQSETNESEREVSGAV